MRDGAKDVLIIGKIVGFLNELVEEIFVGVQFVGSLFEFHFGDEFEGARRGGRVLGPDF